jgi:hypothetical protein
MKDLEKLDAVQMSEDGNEARLRRKSMVDRCQVSYCTCSGCRTYHIPGHLGGAWL